MHRYDQIMDDIDNGLTDEELARLYYKQSQINCESSFRQAVKCMHVYRLAHDKRNTRLSEPGYGADKYVWHGATIDMLLKELRGGRRR